MNASLLKLLSRRVVSLQYKLRLDIRLVNGTGHLPLDLHTWRETEPRNVGSLGPTFHLWTINRDIYTLHICCLYADSHTWFL